MYSKFNCSISNCFYNQKLNRYRDVGENIYNQYEQQSQHCLKKFILDNGHIDGSALQSHWFGIKEADVFISHSHKDLENVKIFAGWLHEEFGLKAFIDSCAWGYCNDLLKIIDNKYCTRDGGKNYDYNLRNYTTSHVHAMLSSAILEMIDRTECLIFYNTPNSIRLESELTNVNRGEKTSSPWIYYELSAVNTILPRKPERRNQAVQEALEHFSFFRDAAIPDIDYNVSSALHNMCTLDDALLDKWLVNYSRYSTYALDVLYELVGLE